MGLLLWVDEMQTHLFELRLLPALLDESLDFLSIAFNSDRQLRSGINILLALCHR